MWNKSGAEAGGQGGTEALISGWDPRVAQLRAALERKNINFHSLQAETGGGMPEDPQPYSFIRSGNNVIAYFNARDGAREAINALQEEK